MGTNRTTEKPEPPYITIKRELYGTIEQQRELLRATRRRKALSKAISDLISGRQTPPHKEQA